MTDNEITPDGAPAVDVQADGFTAVFDGETNTLNLVPEPPQFPAGLTDSQKIDILLRQNDQLGTIVGQCAAQVNWIGTEFSKLLQMAEAMGQGGMGSAILKRAMGMGGGK